MREWFEQLDFCGLWAMEWISVDNEQWDGFFIELALKAGENCGEAPAIKFLMEMFD